MSRVDDMVEKAAQLRQILAAREYAAAIGRTDIVEQIDAALAPVREMVAKMTSPENMANTARELRVLASELEAEQLKGEKS